MASPPVTSRRPRITIDLAGVGFPEIPRMGIHKILSAADPIEEHRHPGAMEIIYLVNGEQAWQRKGITYHLRGNHVFWTAPGEPHRGGAPFHGKGLVYWFQLRLPSSRKGFLCLSPRESRPVVRALRTLPQRHFIGDKRLKSIFEEIEGLVTGPSFPLRKLQMHNRLLEWLTLVIECARTNPAGGPDRDILRVLDEIERRIEHLRSVEDLAAVAGLSVSHFHAKFRRQTGISPAEYLTRRKLERAKAMLASGKHSVTETAHHLGFSSSQYFATVFRKFVRCTPRSFLPKPRPVPR